MSDDPSTNEIGEGENPFLNFDQNANTVHATGDEKFDLNNNEKLNQLSDKLETGLTVNKDTSPLPDCPPSSPFIGDNESISQTTDNDVKEAINILISSENE